MINDKVVNDICHSIESDIGRWLILDCWLKDSSSGIKYWTGNRLGAFWKWNGFDTERVFTNEQAERIEVSFHLLCKIKDTEGQVAVIDSMNKKESKLVVESVSSKNAEEDISAPESKIEHVKSMRFIDRLFFLFTGKVEIK